MFSRVILTVAAAFMIGLLPAAEVGDDTPGRGSLPESRRSAIDRAITGAISSKVFPGAQVVVGDSTGVVYSNCYGYSDYSKREAITMDEVYDLASCTKVLSTTVAIMRLMDEGALKLDMTVGGIIDRFSDSPFKSLTLRQLLTHTTGFKPVLPIVYSLVHSADSTVSLTSSKARATHPYYFDRNLYVCQNIEYDTTYIALKPAEGYLQICENLFIDSRYSQKMDSMIYAAFQAEKRGSYRYSDVNFYLLQQIVECVSMKSLDRLVAEIYQEMGLESIGYLPLKWKERSLIAPTECDMLFRRDTLRGYVHDEMASVLGGVAGHAGLFGNAECVAAMCQMFLKGGEYNGKRILSKEIVEKFTSAALSGRVFRGLGFDKMNPATSVYSSESYGHTGFTGTYFWVDPAANRFLVILTNRVHPSRSNKKYTSSLRADLWESAKLTR